MKCPNRQIFSRIYMLLIYSINKKKLKNFLKLTKIGIKF